jgi:hypothetical protein
MARGPIGVVNILESVLQNLDHCSVVSLPLGREARRDDA